MCTETIVEYNRTSFLSFYVAHKDDCPVCHVVCPSLSVSALLSLHLCLFTVFRVFCSSLSSVCSSKSSSLSFYLHSWCLPVSSLSAWSSLSLCFASRRVFQTWINIHVSFISFFACLLCPFTVPWEITVQPLMLFIHVKCKIQHTVHRFSEGPAIISCSGMSVGPDWWALVLVGGGSPAGDDPLS